MTQKDMRFFGDAMSSIRKDKSDYNVKLTVRLLEERFGKVVSWRRCMQVELLNTV